MSAENADEIETESTQTALPESYVLVYPNGMKVLFQDGEEYIVPDGMSLVDAANNPIKVPELDAFETGKLVLEDDEITFYIREKKFSFICEKDFIEVYVDDVPTFNVGYCMTYFTEARKLWIRKNVLQIPAYCVDVVIDYLKDMALDFGVAWIENRIDFMDDQNQSVQLLLEQENIILNRRGIFVTALAKLDFYPQKVAFYTGSNWINIQNWTSKNQQTKLEQLEALFAIPDVDFNVRYLCGYPHCAGYGPEFEREVICAGENCGLSFHSDCATFMDKKFNTEVIECPLHYQQLQLTVGPLPTIQDRVNEYDRWTRNHPPRPKITESKNQKLKLTKLSRKMFKKLSNPLTQKKLNLLSFEDVEEFKSRNY